MACSCGSNGRKSFSQIVSQDGSSLPTLKYIHCKYQDQFEALFSKIGINATEGNLKLLAYASDTASDEKGVIKDTKGNPIYFSVKEVLTKIDTSKPVNNMCTI